MILKVLIRNIILNQCLEVLFERLFSNFVIPDERTRVIVREIYRIYKEVKFREGINIGSFEEFYEELMRMYSNSGGTDEVVNFVMSQLKLLQDKYPGI